MFCRVEVAFKPQFSDSHASQLLRKIELAVPLLRSEIRWARWLQVYWLDLPIAREELFTFIHEVYSDPVLKWVFTGNLIPSLAGTHGSLLDLAEQSPTRPGCFWGLEKKGRAGVTDTTAQVAIEAAEIVLGRKLEGAACFSGALVMLETPTLTPDDLGIIARKVFANELIETWTVLDQSELFKSDRFHQERIKYDLPRQVIDSPKKSLKTGESVGTKVQTISWDSLSDEALMDLSKKNLWALNLEEMKAARAFFQRQDVSVRRSQLGLSGPTDVEVECIAQTWSEHCKHKLLNAKYRYEDRSGVPSRIPTQIENLFRSTIVETTAQIPRPWLLSVFEDNAGIVAFDENYSICIKVETHNSPSALDPYGGALTGIVGVNRDVLGCGIGAKPIFNTDVFCLARPDMTEALPEKLMHPRRILDGVRRGVEHGGNKSGIPTINGALVFDHRFKGKPLIFCGTVGIMPRRIGETQTHEKKIFAGDMICMVGGRIGKDGIHGATFSSLALTEASPTSAVQLGDPLTQRRMWEFVLRARDEKLFRTLTDNGAGGLSSSVGEMAKLSGGARLNLEAAKLKYPGLKPFEILISESQERMTVAVPKENLEEFLLLAQVMSVEVSVVGQFTDSGWFEIFHSDKCVGALELGFLHGGAPKLSLKAVWNGRPALALPKIKGNSSDFREVAPKILCDLLASPNIASKEWLIRQYDHEVQGTSVIKPLNLGPGSADKSISGPNDGGVVKPVFDLHWGVSVGSGLMPRLSDFDPFLMAQAAVDEAVRNVLCVGSEYGAKDKLLAIVDNFCWPDPTADEAKSGWLVRACFGLREAALALETPLVSGKDSMKNDARVKFGDQEVVISVPPTLLVTALGRVKDVKYARSAEFKRAGDIIYVLGGTQLGILGSELYSHFSEKSRLENSEYIEVPFLAESLRLPEPNWSEARLIYAWLGGALGKEQSQIYSAKDVSDGGILVAVSECLFARGLGASVELPGEKDMWEQMFGEGFHSFIVTTGEEGSRHLEAEWKQLGVPFRRLGMTNGSGRLSVKALRAGGTHQEWEIGADVLYRAWKKEGYWE